MCNHHRNCFSRRRFMIAGAAAGLLAACGQSADNTAGLAALEIDRGTSCALDGMLVADYPGPKGQIHYANRNAPDFFCDTVEMFHVYLHPEVVQPVRALFVQDMGKADWDEPRGHWIDARSAWFVHGSSRRGSMGPTIGTFAEESDARRFAEEFGGNILRFDAITADMVVLDGGALHDSRM